MGTYERAQQDYKHAVSRWWSETSDGWLTFGLGGRASASDDDEFGGSGVPPTDENAQPTALRRALTFLAHRGIIRQPPPTPRVAGPDNRVHTQRFPSHMLAELEAAGAWPYNRPCAQQYVGKSQSCMVISGRLIVHAPEQKSAWPRTGRPSLTQPWVR